jgi:hypothetical protein
MLTALLVPVSATYAEVNETLEINDHKMVFQLANVLNKMNGNQSKLTVNFIPFINSNPKYMHSTLLRRSHTNWYSQCSYLLSGWTAS